MKIVTLRRDEFEEFAHNHQLNNFYQSVEYGRVMAKFGFDEHYVGFIHNNSLIGASLILSKPIFLGFKYGYAPHGLLLDYSDTNMIPTLIKKLKSFLYRKSFLILKIDPLIIKSIRDEDGNVIKENSNINEIMNTLKNSNMVHCGFNLYLESVKPRWHAIVDMQNKTATELFNNCEKQLKNKLRKASKFGIEIYKGKNTDVEKVYNFIKDKGNYSLKYYQELKNSFQDNLDIFFARLNTNKYVKNSQILYQREQDINDYLNNIIQNEGVKGKDIHSVLNKKMESDKILAAYKKHLVNSTNLLKQFPDNIDIGGAIVIRFQNKIYLLIDGMLPEYKYLSAGHLLRWKILESYCSTNSNIEYYDLNAISGDFSESNAYKGLNESKLGFNADATEYIGEFNLIINKAIYSLYIHTKDKYSLKEQKK